MIGVEDRLPSGLPTVDEALLDPGTLDAALDATGVPPLAPLALSLSRRLDAMLSWILLEVRGDSGIF